MSTSSYDFMTPSSTDGEEVETSSESGSDSDDEKSSQSQLDDTVQTIRLGLQQFLHGEFCEWMNATTCIAPAGDGLPRHTYGPGSAQSVEEDGQHNQVRDYCLMGCSRLACPFNISNPQKYKTCLLYYDLRSIEDVINHLGRHHMKPAYCPICWRTFNTAMDRDEHILERACELRDKENIDGLKQHQRDLLEKRDEMHLSDEKRWQSIWNMLFPNQAPPSSAYMNTGCGLKVSMAREYWRIHGRECVWQYLCSLGPVEQQMNDPGAQDTLFNLALQDLLSTIIEEHDANK